MVSDGILNPVTRGIFTVGAEPSWTGRAWSGILLGGPSAVLGLDAAAYLNGLARTPPDEITLFVADGRADRPGWHFVEAARTGTGEPPRTGAEATLIDLCGSLDEDGITALLADAISGRRTTADTLLEELAGRSRHRNRQLLRDILGDVSVGAHSALERRFMIEVEKTHGLPVATRQGFATRGRRSDAWYREYQVVVELDSKLYHSGGAAFRDMARDNEHSLAGVLSLRFGWAHVTGTAACTTAVTLGQVLMSRGWEGPIQPCRRCRLMHAV